jgi:hypothetical protein
MRKVMREPKQLDLSNFGLTEHTYEEVKRYKKALLFVPVDSLKKLVGSQGLQKLNSWSLVI